jgi:hypothetical protein
LIVGWSNGGCPPQVDVAAVQFPQNGRVALALGDQFGHHLPEQPVKALKKSRFTTLRPIK